MIADNELAGMLLDARLIDHDRLDQALLLQKRHGGDLYSVVIENGFVDEERTIEAVAARLNLPCVSLREFEADPAILRLLAEDIAVHHRVVPLGLSDDRSIFLAMANPIDLDAMQAVAVATGHDVIALLAGPLDIERTLERVYDGARPAPGLGGIFAPAPSGSMDDDGLDDMLSLPDLDELPSDAGEGFIVETEAAEAQDVFDLYGAPRQQLFQDDGDLFVSANGLSDEGRKRLADVARVEDIEAVRPAKGKTEAFRGWDDEEEIEPANVDRGLFNVRPGARPAPPPTAPPPARLPPPPPRSSSGAIAARATATARTSATGPRPSVAAAPSVPPPGLPARPTSLPPAARSAVSAPPPAIQPGPLPASSSAEPRRLFPRRDLASSPPASAPPPAAAPAPRQEAPRIGATIAELPRERAEVKRMGRPGGSTRPTREIDPFENLETRDLVLGLLRSLVKKGVLTPQDILTEIVGNEEM